MVFQARSQFNFETDGHPFAFSPLTLNDDVAEDLESNNLKGEGPNGLIATIDLVGGILSMSILLMTLFVCLLDDQQFSLNAPTLHPESFALSKINVSDSNLVTLSIDIDLTFGCKQCDYEAVFNRINGMILYKEEKVLSMVSEETFGLGNKELKTVCLKFASSRNEQQILEEMEKDLENGRVHLRLKIENLVYFKKWGISWPWDGGVDSYCWDLAVGISATTGVGRLIGGGRDECYEP